jgi:DNA-binding MarR family transcriptional regulator
MASMIERVAVSTAGQDRGRLSPCVCDTLRMVTRAVTQLYDDVLRPSGLRVTQFSILATIARLGPANLKQLEDALAIDQTTLTRSLNILQRDGLIERAPHPDRRIKAMRLTSKGRRVLEVARPLWTQAQHKVLREVGTKAWADAEGRLTHLLHVAVRKRRLGRERARARPRRPIRRASRMKRADG